MPNVKTTQFRTTSKRIQQLAAQVAEKSAVFCRIFCTTATLLGLLLPGGPTTAHAAAAGETAPATTDYHLAIELHPEAHRLIGSAELSIAPLPQSLRLRLVPQAVIESLRLNGSAVPYDFAGGVLTVKAAAPARRAAQQLTIRYRADFTATPPQETVGIEDPSFGISATIRGEGTYLSAGVPWFPQLPGTRGRHRIEVSAPAGVTAVTAGRLLHSATRAGRTVTSWQSDLPMEGLALSAGAFTVDRDDFDGIQLLTFLSADNAALAPGYLAAMRRHLAFYRELLGPYPYPKFAVVENFLPTGYGLPSWTLLGSSVIRLPFLLDTSLPHEIVHSWWGNAVEVDYARGNWSEGLTTYLADYLLKERAGAAEARDYRRKILRDYAALVTDRNDFPLRSFHGRMAKYQQAVGYGKGAMTFHMLRREVGERTFWRGLRRMGAEGNGKSLGWGEIERIFSSETGRDLRWFFAQWVERAGAPRLALDGVRIKPSAGGWTVSGTIRQHGEPYRLDITLRLTAANGAVVDHAIRLNGPRTPFSLATGDRPTALEADPENELFRRLAPEEIPATVNDLLEPQRPLVVVAEGREPLREAARDLLRGLHWEDAEVRGEQSVSPAQLAGRDLLLLGWPVRRELQPTLPASLEIAPDGTFAWQGSSGDALFAVVTAPDAAATTALLLAETTAAAAAVAPKISHYGRYSLLLFASGRNLVKTTWEPAASPMKVLLPTETPP